jgi:GTPase SAR1 family protein
MAFDERQYIRRRINDELLHAVDAAEVCGVLLVGGPGSGKTVLLRMLEQDLVARGRAAFLITLRDLRDPGDLGDRIVKAVAGSPFKRAATRLRTVRSSAGAAPLSEAATMLRELGRRLPAPILLLDGLDESPYPLRMATAVEELSYRLTRWHIVVSSRRSEIRIARLDGFRVIDIPGVDAEEARKIFELYGRPLPASALDEAVRRTPGNLYALRLLADELRDSGPIQEAEDVSVAGLVDRMVERAVASSPEPQKLATLLEQLALAGGPESISSLAARSHLRVPEAQRLLDLAEIRRLLTLDPDGRVVVVHALVREVILTRRILAPRFRLADLAFGSEEAERDSLLDQSFVTRPGLDRIISQRRSIIVGDRGSGKSAIFRKLAATTPSRDDHSPVAICPVADPARLLHRIVDKDAVIDTEALRAAWLVVVASLVASTVGDSAPKRLRRAAANLRAAFGLEDPPRTIGRRLLGAAARPFAGTTLKLAVGPVILEAQLPVGTKKAGGPPINVEAFLRVADEFFGALPLRVVVMFDRIDELFKYDRVRQQALVQSLLQAEASVSLLENIGLVVFLRTDLFELYDIQEKTKLVSRMLSLDWSEEDWLQLLVNRVFANEAVRRLAATVNAQEGALRLANALVRDAFPRTA